MHSQLTPVCDVAQLLPLLLLTMLTSYLTSRLAQPDLTKRQLSGILTSINQAHGRYNSLLHELENAQGQVKATEDRCAGTGIVPSRHMHLLQFTAPSGAAERFGTAPPALEVYHSCCMETQQARVVQIHCIPPVCSRCAQKRTDTVDRGPQSMSGMGQRSAHRTGVWGPRLAQTLDKVDALEKQFAGADGSERKAFSRGAKVDPQVFSRHDATRLWTLNKALQK